MDLQIIRNLPSVEKMSKVKAISLKTGVPAAYVLCMVEMGGWIYRWLSDNGVNLGEMEVTAFNRGVLDELSIVFKGHSKAELRDFCVFLETGEHKDVKWALKRRGEVIESIQLVLEEVTSQRSGVKRATVDQISPVVRKLAKEAVDAAGDVDLSAKDKIQLFEKMAKLQAQLTGELVDRKSLEVGPTEMFMEIMKAAREMDKSDVEALTGSIEARFELIE